MRVTSKNIGLSKLAAAMLTCHDCREPFNNNVLDSCPNCGWNAGTKSEGGQRQPEQMLDIQPRRDIPKSWNAPIPNDVRRIASSRLDTKNAQAFFPSHAFDKNYRNPIDSGGRFMNSKQQELVDIVLNNSPSPRLTANPNSQLLEMIMFPTKFLSESQVSPSAKRILYEAFENSNLVSEGISEKSVLQLHDSFSDTKVNSLKAEGLISGMGRKCNLTEKGRKALVKMMLDSEAAITASGVQKLIKTAVHAPLKQTLHGEGTKIVRDHNGNWVEEEGIDEQLNSYSEAKLRALYASILRTEADTKNTKLATFAKRYDMDKLYVLKDKIWKRLQEKGS